MGKFDWKRGIEYASEGLRENRDRKRAYERADEENAMTISRLLAEQGMPVPEPLMKMLSTKYPITSQLMPGLDKAIREGKQSQLEQDLMKKYQYEMIESQFREPAKPPKKSTELQMFEALTNMPIEEFGKLPNDQKRNLLREWSALKRKEETAKTIRPRYQIIKNESTGKVTRINVDTGEETEIRPESPALMKKAQAKEEAERIKQEKQNTVRATKLYQDWMKGDREDPQALANVNTLLSEFGYQITPITNKVDWGFDTKNYQLGKIGEVPDPLGILK